MKQNAMKYLLFSQMKYIENFILRNRSLFFPSNK